MAEAQQRGSQTVSIILPTFNERHAIGSLITRILRVLDRNNITGEIIVVDDGSQDGTIDVVRQLSQLHKNVKLVLRPKKMGLGTAFCDGYRASTGDLICTMESDLSQFPEDLPELLRSIRNGQDIVVGSRYARGALVGGVIMWKYILSRLYNFVVRFIWRTGLSDQTTGYRVYKRVVLSKINLNAISSRGFPSYIEILLHSKVRGFKITEVPIRYIYRRRGSKFGVEAARDYLKTLLAIIFSKRVAHKA